MRNFLYVLAVLWPFAGTAQSGHYFLSHYAPGDKRIDHVSFDMAQGSDGVLFFATRAGILQFDGKNWDLIQGSGAVYAIETDKDGTIYWGGAGGFGKLTRGPDGRMAAAILSTDEVGNVFQVTSGNDAVYFLNDDAFYACTKNDKATAIKSSARSGAFNALVGMFGKPYISTERSGIFTLQSPHELARSSFDTEKTPDIIFASRLDDSYLIGTSDNRLFICRNDLSLTEVVLKETGYVDASVIVDGSWVNSRLVAIATLRGGIVFVDPVTGSIVEIINYNTGLPDNEIYALITDEDGNVWVSHNYGLTRIAPFLPFRSYSSYDGLKGNLLCAEMFDDEVYVGTSLGLFKLVREEVYDEFTYYVDAQEDLNTASPLPAESEVYKVSPGADSPEEVKKRRGLFWFLKRNREPKPAVSQDQPPATPPEEGRNEAGITQPPVGMSRAKEKRIQRVLRSTQYAYRQVSGIPAKVSGLITVDGKLLASGLGGVFQIRGLSATPVLEEPARLVFATREKHLIVPTHNDKVGVLLYQNDGWKQSSLLDHLDDRISSVFEDDDGELWLCGMDNTYQVTASGGQFSVRKVIPLDNPDFSRTIGLHWRGAILLVNSNGFFRYDDERETMIRVDSLPSPGAYFTSGGKLWYSDQHAWYELGRGEDRSNTHMLTLLSDIRHITGTGRSGHLWIINGNNELYEFFGGKINKETTPFPLLLRSVMQGNHAIGLANRIMVDQEGGPLTFNVVQPNYFGTMSSEYRYLLTGISDTWSEWSTANSQISFPYLPQGSYMLRVQARDIFGTIQEMKDLRLHVRPPFWKSSWFYAMELTIFALLGLLSLKLSTRYRLVSRLLALLTIILLIEFIQTLAGYSFSTSSPVTNFLLQVGVAFVILPVEGYLRKTVFRSVNAESRLLKAIEELNRREKGGK
jgi:hypothetical protein